jgi:hypothetical protein
VPWGFVTGYLGKLLADSLSVSRLDSPNNAFIQKHLKE